MTIFVGPEHSCSSISQALTAAENIPGPVTIQLSPGEYREKLVIQRPGVRLCGTSADDVRIVWSDSALTPHTDIGTLGTFNSFTVYVGAPDCSLVDLTVENDAGPGNIAGQAVALYADADTFMVHRCKLLGHQDTLCTGPLPDDPPPKSPPFLHPYTRIDQTAHAFRQIYQHCYIAGDIDFIFGSARALFRNCEIASTKRDDNGIGYVCAPSHSSSETFGYVFLDCELTGSADIDSVYLARPWRRHGRTCFYHCHLGPHINPNGWHNWDKKENETCSSFTEIRSHGPGANPTNRVSWANVSDAAEPPNLSTMFDDWSPEY